MNLYLLLTTYLICAYDDQKKKKNKKEENGVSIHKIFPDFLVWRNLQNIEDLVEVR